ncbi:MAG: hypothetical protein FWG88_07640 [Oscillospiraceae bacterium]|nr:hypothetical protein [Oscillospiraceae bacterium]
MSIPSAVEKSIETGRQQSLEAQLAREASYPSNAVNGQTRNVGGTMGKHEFLLLLATQLRYQNPLDPASETEFASQLAQFASLEQMQNTNTTLSAMLLTQSYSLIGKLVYGEQYSGDNLIEYYGIVESIYTRDGLTYAMIEGYDFGVPISVILEVFDTDGLTTPDMLIQTSNSLIGRSVVAQVGTNTVQGIVTGVVVNNGQMYAYIDEGNEELRLVPVGSIYDIRMAPTAASTEETPAPIDGDDDDDLDLVEGLGGDGDDDTDPVTGLGGDDDNDTDPVTGLGGDGDNDTDPVTGLGGDGDNDTDPVTGVGGDGDNDTDLVVGLDGDDGDDTDPTAGLGGDGVTDTDPVTDSGGESNTNSDPVAGIGSDEEG